MYRRIWTPHNSIKTDIINTIHFYDGGTICGILYDNVWTSWEIISRDLDVSGCIIETLKEMPQDYVPFHILHVESHPVYEANQELLVIPGWTIQVLPLKTPLLQTQAAHQQVAHQQVAHPHQEVAHQQELPRQDRHLHAPRHQQMRQQQVQHSQKGQQAQHSQKGQQAHHPQKALQVQHSQKAQQVQHSQKRQQGQQAQHSQKALQAQHSQKALQAQHSQKPPHSQMKQSAPPRQPSQPMPLMQDQLNRSELNQVVETFPQPAPRPPPRPQPLPFLQEEAQIPMIVEGLQQSSGKRGRKAKKRTESSHLDPNQSHQGASGVSVWTPLLQKGSLQQVPLQQSLVPSPALQKQVPYPSGAAVQSVSQDSRHSRRKAYHRKQRPLVAELNAPYPTISA